MVYNQLKEHQFQVHSNDIFKYLKQSYLQG
jgi:hypothetical protein